MGLNNVGRLDEFMWGQIGTYGDYKNYIGLYGARWECIGIM